MRIFSLLTLIFFSATVRAEERIFKLPTKSVKIEVDNCNLKITGNEADEVKIKSSLSTANCKHLLEHRDGKLIVVNKRKKDGCDADYELVVPTKSNILVATDRSNIDILAIDGNVDIDGGNLNVTSNNVAGSEKINAGQIKYKAIGSAHSINIHAGNSEVDINFMKFIDNTYKIKLDSGLSNFIIALPAVAKVNLHSKAGQQNIENQFTNTQENYNFDIYLKNGLGSGKIVKN